MTIYRSALISRRPGISESEFREHWIRVHGTLSSKLPGLGTYRQNHIVERFYEKLEPLVQAIDGISQLSFESVAAMEVSDASPEYAAVKADIPNFQGGITILVLESTEVSARPGRYDAKLLWVSTRRTDATGRSLQQQWLASPRDVPSLPGMGRFVQNFVVDRGHPVHAGVPAGDAAGVETLSEMWFESEDALRKAVDSDAGRRLIHDDPLLRPMAVYRIEEIRIR
jgi:uncharacterized protein (TIGR02118 family)